MIRKHYGRVKRFFVSHWVLLLITVGGGLIMLTTAVQLFYPNDKLLPFAKIDDIQLGGWSKQDATKRLDEQFAASSVAVYMGEAKKAYVLPKPSEIGLTIRNDARVQAMNYPWYLRIAPFSILWGHFVVQSADTPDYQRDTAVTNTYIATQFGTSCDVKPKDASLRADDVALKIVPAEDGGTCKINDVTTALGSIEPRLGSDNKVMIAVQKITPIVGDEKAKALSQLIMAKLGDGLQLKVGTATQAVDVRDVLGWLDFATTDEDLTYSINAERINAYLVAQVAPKVAVAAGVSKIATQDFVEVSRQNGANGQALNYAATSASIKSFIDGAPEQASAVTQVIAPTESYTHTYTPTDTGLSALMKNYANDHPGTYAVSLIELSGSRRRASYNETQSYTTASTYKLFVAYSTLRRIESGEWEWSNQITGGQDLSTCFDKMIVNSDNACAEALLNKIGFRAITNEARDLGCTSTSFLGSDGIKTTSADLSLFLAMLQSGQMLTQQSSRDRLLNAMKRNVYRSGIPAGANGQVADKVGFLDGLYHDAAVVYSPSGTYVLVILTNDSSWANIAELTRQLEALRTQ